MIKKFQSKQVNEKIFVESEPNVGSEFSFSLTLVESANLVEA